VIEGMADANRHRDNEVHQVSFLTRLTSGAIQGGASVYWLEARVPRFSKVGPVGEMLKPLHVNSPAR